MPVKPTTTIIIRLEIKGDPAEAYAVVDDILDSGVLQDAINENNRAVLHVTSALCEASRPA